MACYNQKRALQKNEENGQIFRYAKACSFFGTAKASNFGPH
jgi:hypothetical protein